MLHVAVNGLCLCLALASPTPFEAREPAPPDQPDVELATESTSTRLVQFEATTMYSEPSYPGDTRKYEDRTRPVPHVQLELGVAGLKSSPAYVDSPVLLRVVSDARGIASGSLRFDLDQVPETDPVIWFRVRQPGFTLSEGYARLDEDTRAVKLNVWVREGGTTFGVVRDERGARVEKAYVHLIDDDGAISRWPYVGVSRADGRFALHFPRSASFGLHARKTGVGAWRTGSRALAVQSIGSPIEITLLGGLAWSGKVVDRNGLPLEGLRVLATSSASGDGLRGHELGVHETSLGAAGGIARTDETGTFELVGLAADEYRLRGDWARAGTTDATSLISRKAFPIGTVQIGPDSASRTFEVADPRLVVRVRDHLGELVDLEARSEDPDRLSVGLTSLDRRRDGRGGETLVLRSIRGTEAIRRPLPEHPVRVYVKGPDRTLAEALVQPAKGTDLTEVELTLEDPETAFELELDLPNGRAWGVREYGVRLWSTLGGNVASMRAPTKDPRAEHVVSLSPGTYTLDYETTAFELLIDREGRHPWLAVAPQDVVATRGGRTRISPVFTGAGFVELVPRGSGSLRDAQTGELPCCAETRPYRPLHGLGDGDPGPRIRLTYENGVALHDAWFIRHGGRHWEPGWELGEHARLQRLLAQGGWTLEVVHGARVLLTRPFEIRPDEVTRVEW